MSANRHPYIDFSAPVGRVVVIPDKVSLSELPFYLPSVVFSVQLIGWFMVEGNMQGRGIGSGIFADVRAALKGMGYNRISLGAVKENEQAVAFWKAQGFEPTGEEAKSGKHTVVTYSKQI